MLLSSGPQKNPYFIDETHKVSVHNLVMLCKIRKKLKIETRGSGE